MSGGWNLKFTFHFLERTYESLHLTSEVLYIERSWTYLQFLFELIFSFTEFLNVAVFRYCEVTLTKAELLCVEFCHFCVVSYICKLFILLFYQRCFEY
jgi:hypothetical protein